MKKISGRRRDAGGRHADSRIRLVVIASHRVARMRALPPEAIHFATKMDRLRRFVPFAFDPGGIGMLRQGSVYDAISVRVAEDIGFEVGMFGGFGGVTRGARRSRYRADHADRAAEQMRRMSRASASPCWSMPTTAMAMHWDVHRTVQELEKFGRCRAYHGGHAAAAGLRAGEDATHFAGGRRRQDEGRARRRGDPSLVIVGRTGAASIASLDDAIARARAYEATGVDGCSSPASKRGASGGDRRRDERCRSCSAARPRR